jgi:hypothetical protein
LTQFLRKGLKIKKKKKEENLHNDVGLAINFIFVMIVCKVRQKEMIRASHDQLDHTRK